MPTLLPADQPKTNRRPTRRTVVLFGVVAIVALAAGLRLITGNFSSWLAFLLAPIAAAGLIAAALPVVLQGSGNAWRMAAEAAAGAQHIVAGYATRELAQLLTACGHPILDADKGAARVLLALYPQGLQVWSGTPMTATLTIPWDQTGSVTVGTSHVAGRDLETVAIQTPNGTEISVVPMELTGRGALLPSAGRAIGHVDYIRRLRRR